MVVGLVRVRSPIVSCPVSSWTPVNRAVVLPISSLVGSISGRCVPISIRRVPKNSLRREHSGIALPVVRIVRLPGIDRILPVSALVNLRSGGIRTVLIPAVSVFVLYGIRIGGGVLVQRIVRSVVGSLSVAWIFVKPIIDVQKFIFIYSVDRRINSARITRISRHSIVIAIPVNVEHRW